MQKQRRVTLEWAGSLCFCSVAIRWLLELVLKDLWCPLDVEAVSCNVATEVVKSVLSLPTCITILVMKWSFTHTICYLLRYHPLGLSASQDSFLETSSVSTRLFVSISIWKFDVKNIPKWFFPKKVSFLPEIHERLSSNYICVIPKISFFCELFWSFAIVGAAVMLPSVVCIWHFREV